MDATTAASYWTFARVAAGVVEIFPTALTLILVRSNGTAVISWLERKEE